MDTKQRPVDLGAGNIRETTQVVADRLGAGDIGAVIIASSSGATAVRFAPAWKPYARLICVTDPIWGQGTDVLAPGMRPENKTQLEAMGVEIVDCVPWTSSVYSWAEPGGNVHNALDLNVVTFDAFRMVGGEPLSVAIESGLMACNAGRVKPGEEIVAVAGSASAGYTAIVMRAAVSAALFAKDRARRPEVKEILVMPRAMRWW